MDLKQLETFIEVVNNKSFSKAAQILYLTQPTVSSHISALEKEFNSKLIKRNNKIFEITENGVTLYTYAKKMLNIKDKINDKLLNTRSSQLKIGSSSTVSFSDLPQILFDFNLINEDVKFTVISSDSLDIISKVKESFLELGFVGAKIDDSELTFTKFTEDKLVFAIPNTNEYQTLLSEKNWRYKLLKMPFIIREDDSGTKIEIIKYLNNIGFSTDLLNIKFSLSDPFTIIESVKLGLGFSIISSKMLKNDKNKILIRELTDEPFCREFFIVTPKEKYLSSTAKTFINHIIKKYEIE